MNNPAQFVTSLKSYDKDNIKDATLKKLKKFTQDERFVPEQIKAKSGAAMSVAMWVKAMDVYSDVLKVVTPLRAQLAEAEKEAAVATAALNKKRAELQAVRDKIENFNRNLRENQNILEALIKQKEDIEINIMPALQANKVVLMDRYYFSTAAYQGALGLDPEEIRTQNENFSPIPDRVLIFLTSPDICLDRIESSRDQKSAFEKLDYLQNVQNIFKSFSGPNISIINSIGSISEIHEKVLTEIENMFDSNF